MNPVEQGFSTGGPCPPSKERVRNTTVWGLPKFEGVPVRDHEELHELNKSPIVCNGNGTLHKQIPMDIKKEKILDEADIQLLMPAGDHDHMTLNTELPTPSENYGNGHAELVNNEEDGSNRSASRGGEKGLCMRLFVWLFGSKEQEDATQAQVSEEDHEHIMEMLYEPPKMKLLLNLGLFLVCSLGVFMFVYFSL